MAILWQRSGSDYRRDVRVRNGDSYGLPDRIEVVVSVTDDPAGNLTRRGALYILLDVPDAGPALAWVGSPGAKRNVGHFIHPESGQTWPQGELALAVKFARDFMKA